MSAIHTILCPTDFSECSQHAFGLACRLARDLGARLVVLHVAPMEPPPKGIDLVDVLPPDEDYREALEKRLQWLASPCPGVHIERWLETGEPIQKILEVAQECRCDLIVMGMHGRTGLNRLLMGSVAEQVLRRASCPVLTAKASAVAA